jgi:molybdopterin/thiamine biosynthesis adenylyltransferase
MTKLDAYKELREEINPALVKYGIRLALCRCGGMGLEIIGVDPAPDICPDCLDKIFAAEF